jgi:hypothetical protein
VFYSVAEKHGVYNSSASIPCFNFLANRLSSDVPSERLDNVTHRAHPVGDEATFFLRWGDQELQKADERLAPESWGGGGGERKRISCVLIYGRVAGCESGTFCVMQY